MIGNFKVLSLIFVFGLKILIADGANFTVISMEGKDVKVDIPNLGPFVRIELVIDYNKKIKNWYHPMIREDYNYTVVGDKGLFEIFNVTSEKTGFYQFIFAIPEDNYIYAFHVTVTLDVIMAELLCDLQFPEYFITDNDCPHMKKSKIGGVCALKLYRPIKKNFTMKWRGLEGGRMQDFTRVERLNLSYMEAHQADVPLNINDAFECHVEQTNLQCSKQFRPENIIYARNKSGRELTSYHTREMTHANKHNVTCQVNASPSLQCFYEWVLMHGNTEIIYPGKTLHTNDFMNGVYKCYATCYLQQYSPEKCVLLSDMVKFSDQHKMAKTPDEIPTSTEIISITTSNWIYLFSVVVLCIALLMCCYLNRTKIQYNLTDPQENMEFFPKRNEPKNQKNLQKLADNKGFIEKIELGVMKQAKVKVHHEDITDLIKEFSNMRNCLKEDSQYQKLDHELQNFKRFDDALANLEKKLVSYSKYLFKLPKLFPLLSTCRNEIMMEKEKLEKGLKELEEKIHFPSSDQKEQKDSKKPFSKPHEQDEITTNLSNKLIVFRNFLGRLQKRLKGDTIIKIKFEKCLDNDATIIWNNIENSDFSQKILEFKKEINSWKELEEASTSNHQGSILFEEENILKLNKFSEIECFINKIQNGFEAFSHALVDNEKISKSFEEIANLFNIYKELSDTQKFHSNSHNYRMFLDRFDDFKNALPPFQKEFEDDSNVNTHLYQDFYETLSPKVKELHQVLKNLEDEVANESGQRPNEHEQNLEDLKHKLLEFEHNLEMFENDCKGYTMVQLNLEKCLNLDDDLLKFWKSLEKHPNITRPISLLHEEITKRIEEVKKDEKNEKPEEKPRKPGKLKATKLSLKMPFAKLKQKRNMEPAIE